MPDLSTIKCLVIDNGLFLPIAESLGEAYGHVYYAMPQREAFPTSRSFMVGQGLENVERVLHYENYLDRVDLIVFPDIYHGALQTYLRSHGHRVWGSGAAESLELDRWSFKETLKSVGLAVGQAWEITGIEALREFLDDPEHDGVWVKVSYFRGDCESWESINGRVSKDYLDELAHRLGPYGEQIRFIVEAPIKDAIEVGFDGFCVDGEYPDTVLFGYEKKDAGFIGRVVEGDELPAALRIINERMAPVMRALGCRGFYSNEARIVKDGTAYFIDPTMRAGSPPSELYMSLFSNWAEVIYEGAEGNLVDLKPNGKFGAQIVFKSGWAEHNYLPLLYPTELEPWVKLHNKFVAEDGQVYVAPMGFPEIGSVIAIGDSMDEVTGTVIERMERIEGLELKWDEDAMQKCMDAIEKGRERGIEWS